MATEFAFFKLLTVLTLIGNYNHRMVLEANSEGHLFKKHVIPSCECLVFECIFFKAAFNQTYANILRRRRKLAGTDGNKFLNLSLIYFGPRI